MTCDEGKELIQRSIDNDLDSQETMLMNEHIRTCPDCAALLDRLTLLSRNLAELPRVSPPFSLVDSILPKLDQIDAEARAALSDKAIATSTQASVPAPAVAATELPRRRNRSTMRRITGAIAAGIVAGLAIVSVPSLFQNSSNDSNANESVAISDASSAQQSARAYSLKAQEAAPGDSASDSEESEGIAPQVTDSLLGESPLSVQFSEPGEVDKEVAQTGGGNASGEVKESAGSQESHSTAPSANAVPSAPSAPSTSPLPSATASATAQETSKAMEGGAVAGSAAEDKSLAPSDSLRNQEFAGLFAVPLVWISPDQKLKAVAEEQRISVYSNEDNSLIFQSASHGGDSLSSVYWEQDSSALRYSWKTADGVITDMVWNATANAESPATVLPK